MANKWVYTFKEGNMTMRNLLGGKGANLAEMTEIGLPVPQGFTITTEACTQYYEDGRKINDEIMAQAMDGVKWMEEVNGKKFGDFTHCVSKNYQAVADPLYSHLFPIWKDQNIKGFKADDAPEDYDNSHLFKITPPAGAGSVEIRIRDRWGNNYNRNIKL